eukprot:2991720-Alexandrium_andersonii.AAC.2
MSCVRAEPFEPRQHVHGICCLALEVGRVLEGVHAELGQREHGLRRVDASHPSPCAEVSICAP